MEVDDRLLSKMIKSIEETTAELYFDDDEIKKIFDMRDKLQLQSLGEK